MTSIPRLPASAISLTRIVAGTRSRGALRRAVGWVPASLGRPGRLLAVAWLLGVFTVGAAGMAHADGLFSHPTYTDSQQTLFDAHGPIA